MTNQTNQTNQEQVYYKHNFARIDARGAFVELVDYSLSIDKMLFRFVKYNEQTKRQDYKIDIYMDVIDYLGLCNLVESTYLMKKADFLKNKGQINDSLFEKLSGYTPDKVKGLVVPFQVPAGKGLSKTFKIIPSTKYCYNLMALYRLGNESATGLIMPEGKTLSYIQIPMSHEALAGFLMYGKIRIEAYETVKLRKYAGEYVFNRA